MRVSLTSNGHMTLYSTMVCFINLVLKSVVLSYTPDSEHILEIAMYSKNKQSLYEVFHLHKKDYTSGMCMPPSPNLFNLYVVCFQYLIIIR